MLVVYEETKKDIAYLDEHLTSPTEELLSSLKGIYGQNAQFGYFTQSITMGDIRSNNGAPYLEDAGGMLVLKVNTQAAQIPPEPPSVEERVRSLEDAITVLMGL